MAKELLVGKAQKMVLDAVSPGHTITTWTEANNAFEKIGIVVGSRREGSASVPVITVKNRYGGGFTAGGDGDTWQAYANLTDDQKSALAPWIKK